jgi:1,4-alpha-glucan branching enzyme
MAAAAAPSAFAPVPHTPRISAPPASAPVPRFGEQRTTEQKIEDFYGIRQQGNEVLFSAKFDAASKVLIAGDFNGWNPVSPLQMNRPGEWRVKLPLAPGRYRYRFIVDGQWVTDPHNTAVETNQFGELNNVLEVA